MKRYILTGTPGAGKTALLRHLELDGYSVVEEAATDIIALEQAQGVAEPWSRASFIDAIVNLQRDRQLRAARLTDDLQFFDRSPICTYALAKNLGYLSSAALSREIERERIYRGKYFSFRASDSLQRLLRARSRPQTRYDFNPFIKRRISRSITRSSR